jgi:PAS domain S-box-containing protein
MTLKHSNREAGRPDPVPYGSTTVAHDRAAASPGQPFFPDPEIVAYALEASEIGVWEWDITSDRITWSRNLEEIHRLPAGGFDGTFSSFEQDIHPDDRPGVIAAIKEALQTRRPYSVIYRLPPRPNQTERWIAAAGSVLDQGSRQKLLGICRDVTSRVHTERELRMRAHHQEIVARLGARALTEEDLQGLLDEIASTVATMLDVDLVNILELVPGDEALVVRSGYGFRSDITKDSQIPISARSQANYTLAAFGPVLVSDLRSETRFTPSPLLLEHGIVSGMSTTIVGHDRRKYGIFSVHTKRPRAFADYDVALLTSVANIIAGAIQRRQLDERQKMMIRELHHHSGNLFSQLLALLSQTAATSRTVRELVTKFEARVFALANANRLVVEGGWQPALVLNVLKAQLAPYLERVSLDGPNVYVEPAVAFALSSVTHELVSNAVKHGSLSVLSGHVELRWSVDRTQRAGVLVLNWHEQGGPPPRRSVRSGFGSRLINAVIKRQMNGTVRRSYAKGGLRCRLAVPLSHERWPVAAID